MGNIVTTVTVCLIVAEAANIVSIFTKDTNHVYFVIFAFTMAAFLWLNSMGYYIWSTFR